MQPAAFAIQPKPAASAAEAMFDQPPPPAAAAAAPAAAGPVDPFAGMQFEDLSLPAGVSSMGGDGTDPFGNALEGPPVLAAAPADPLAAMAMRMGSASGQANLAAAVRAAGRGGTHPGGGEGGGANPGRETGVLWRGGMRMMSHL